MASSAGEYRAKILEVKTKIEEDRRPEEVGDRLFGLQEQLGGVTERISEIIGQLMRIEAEREEIKELTVGIAADRVADTGFVDELAFGAVSNEALYAVGRVRKTSDEATRTIEMLNSFGEDVSIVVEGLRMVKEDAERVNENFAVTPMTAGETVAGAEGIAAAHEEALQALENWAGRV